MILCIGEILADMIGEAAGADGAPVFKMFCGGAPFNVAVNAKQSGAEVAFIGRVGRDPVGKFLIDYSNKVGFDYLDIQRDGVRNTTLALVTLTDGERDFAFFRHDTADFNIDADSVNLSAYENLNILHLGSLMLSEKAGRDFADAVIKKVRAAKKTLSFDVNFRLDLYAGIEEAIEAYRPYVAEADILKFSDDEITAFTGESTVEAAARALYKENRLLLVTLGSRGSAYYYNGISGVVATEKVKPVDTTGAGDAFFGVVLAKLDGKDISALTKDDIEQALAFGNKAGARATQFKGAVKI